MSPLVTLTTDFGLSEEYVGVMKGVIYSRCPEAVIVDLTHEIPPQNVQRASLVIASAYQYFPQRTVHVIVVDPGVGSSRRIILLEAAGQLFLAPDNGVMTLLFSHAKRFYTVCNSDLFLMPVSDTFHGRDVFAPVAAHLASGNPPHTTGNQIAGESLIRLDMSVPIDCGDHLLGEVTDVDHFGNLITNIDRTTLAGFCAGNFGNLQVYVGKLIIKGIATAYNEAEDDRPIALIGSRGFLEISIYHESAAAKLGFGAGIALYLTKE